MPEDNFLTRCQFVTEDDGDHRIEVYRDGKLSVEIRPRRGSPFGKSVELTVQLPVMRFDPFNPTVLESKTFTCETSERAKYKATEFLDWFYQSVSELTGGKTARV